MRAVLNSERTGSVVDADYWLSHCEGFVVRTPEGRLGVVVEVRFRSRLDRPDELVVCGGMFGNRVEIVPVDDVMEVVPREGRISLSSIPQPVTDRPPRLRLRRA